MKPLQTPLSIQFTSSPLVVSSHPHCFPDSQAGGKELNWFMRDTIEHWEVLIFIYLFYNPLLILFFLLCSVFVFLCLILTRFWQHDYLILTCQINWLILPTGWIYNTLTLAFWVFYWFFFVCPWWINNGRNLHILVIGLFYIKALKFYIKVRITVYTVSLTVWLLFSEDC